MISIFNRKELRITYSMKEQSDIRYALANSKIEYQIKTINRMSASVFSSGSRARSGSFGQNKDLDIEYIFYVRKVDYDNAKFAINRVYNNKLC